MLVKPVCLCAYVRTRYTRGGRRYRVKCHTTWVRRYEPRSALTLSTADEWAGSLRHASDCRIFYPPNRHVLRTYPPRHASGNDQSPQPRIDNMLTASCAWSCFSPLPPPPNAPGQTPAAGPRCFSSGPAPTRGSRYLTPTSSLLPESRVVSEQWRRWRTGANSRGRVPDRHLIAHQRATTSESVSDSTPGKPCDNDSHGRMDRRMRV